MAAAILDLFHLLPPQAAKFLETQAVRAGLVWMFVLGQSQRPEGSMSVFCIPLGSSIPRDRDGA